VTRIALGKISLAAVLAVGLSSGVAVAQDAKAVIAKAEKAMGHVTSVRYSGTGKLGAVAMNWNPTGPWHSTDLTSYTRTVDYPSGSSRELETYAQENPIAMGGQAPFSDPITEGAPAAGRRGARARRG